MERNHSVAEDSFDVIEDPSLIPASEYVNAKPPTDLSDEEAVLQLMMTFQRSPFEFIEETLNEIPQPIKPEFREYVLKLYTIPAHEWSEYAATITGDMFEPFKRKTSLEPEGRGHLTWQQSIFVIAVQRAVNGTLPRKIAVKAGRGTGKSAIMSRLILWFLFSFPLSKIPCTAPTADQLFAVLWSEINLVLSQMKPEFAAFFEWETKFLRMKRQPQVWYARAKTAAKGETGALSGIHADYMASFSDESYDVEDEVFQVAEATQTGELSLMVLVGNAVHDHGYFFDCFGKYADEWIRITMNGEESPIVNKAKIDAQKKQYGENSNHYRASVLGEFPIVASIDVDGWYRLFTDDWLDQVMPINPQPNDDELFHNDNMIFSRAYLGIDPAGDGGDEEAGYVRNQLIAKLGYVSPTSDKTKSALKAIETLEFYNIDGDDTVVDNFGAGADVSQEIAIQSNMRHLIRGKNVGDKCDDVLDKGAYFDERARIFNALLWWGKRGGRIAYDHRLREELKTIFAQKIEQGKLRIMSKKEMRKRGYKSPGRADALSLTFVEDRVMDNLVPRGEHRALTINTKKKQAEDDNDYDRYDSIPSL